jgi:signal transduction histidine kinase
MNIDLARTQLEADHPQAALEVLERSQRAVDQGALEIRRAIASLQEIFPLHYTLQEQLTALVDEFSAPEKVIDCIVEIKEPLVLPRDLSEQVLRVVREALVNARNHSQARCLEVCMRRVDDAYQVEIADDGQGFDPHCPPGDDGRPHFGINIMHARAARLGGRLEIESRAGAGTRVSLTWPQAAAEGSSLSASGERP